MIGTIKRLLGLEPEKPAEVKSLVKLPPAPKVYKWVDPPNTEEVIDQDDFEVTLSDSPMTESQWNIFHDIEKCLKDGE